MIRFLQVVDVAAIVASVHRAIVPARAARNAPAIAAPNTLSFTP